MNKKSIKRRKEEKGITLVALVVTIIVLLILAGVSINLVIGENGIIARARDSSKAAREARLDERVVLAYTDYKSSLYGADSKTLKEALVDEFGRSNVIDNGDGSYTVKQDELERIVKDDEIVVGKTEDQIKQEHPEITNWIPIYTKEHLIKMNSGETIEIEGVQYVFSQDSDTGYILKNDIDLAGVQIGDDYILSGIYVNNVFFGNNKKISNLKNKAVFDHNLGTISSLNIENADFDGNIDTVACIVQNNNIHDPAYGVIENCTVSGTVRIKYIGSLTTYYGMIASMNRGKINNCHNKANVIVERTYNVEMGAIAGANTGEIINCSNTGNITIEECRDLMIGGISGTNGGKINSSYNKGNLSVLNTTALGKYMGGITGLFSNQGIISDCYHIGMIKLKQDYSMSESFAGIANGLGDIKNCYSIPEFIIEGDLLNTRIKGIANDSNITNSYYVGDAVDDPVATKKTLDELKAIEATLGSEWKKDSKNINQGYPILNWQ